MSRNILSGWKEISNYLNRGVRTSQRWERMGMPVHRPALKGRSAVVAFTDDLDRWLARGAPVDATEAPVEATEEKELLDRVRESVSRLTQHTSELRKQTDLLQSQMKRSLEISGKQRLRMSGGPAPSTGAGRGAMLAFRSRNKATID